MEKREESWESFRPKLFDEVLRFSHVPIESVSLLNIVHAIILDTVFTFATLNRCATNVVAMKCSFGAVNVVQQNISVPPVTLLYTG